MMATAADVSSLSTVEKWSYEEVGEWLKQNGFNQQVVDSFMEREVDGETLLKLTPDMRKDLIPSFKYLVKFNSLLDGRYM